MKKYIAEFFGTTILTLVVVYAVLFGMGLPVALIAGIVVGLFVCTIGRISGTHLNPAVTLSLFAFQKISKKDAIGYIIAQFAGALAALILANLFEMKIPAMPTNYSFYSLLAETLGMVVFAFGIASVAMHERENNHAAFIIGGSLTIGALLAGNLGSSGILNPAVALGLNSFGLSYILGPILGALLGMWIYKRVS